MRIHGITHRASIIGPARLASRRYSLGEYQGQRVVSQPPARHRTQIGGVVVIFSAPHGGQAKCCCGTGPSEQT